MVEIELDGKAVEVPQGSMVMHAANKLGTYIPHFCYHKKLSIAANCRMCLVEVEKAPKPLPACATPVSAGMIVRSNSDKAVQAQKSANAKKGLDSDTAGLVMLLKRMMSLSASVALS